MGQNTEAFLISRQKTLLASVVVGIAKRHLSSTDVRRKYIQWSFLVPLFHQRLLTGHSTANFGDGFQPREETPMTDHATQTALSAKESEIPPRSISIIEVFRGDTDLNNVRLRIAVRLAHQHQWDTENAGRNLASAYDDLIGSVPCR